MASCAITTMTTTGVTATRRVRASATAKEVKKTPTPQSASSTQSKSRRAVAPRLVAGVLATIAGSARAEEDEPYWVVGSLNPLRNPGFPFLAMVGVGVGGMSKAIDSRAQGIKESFAEMGIETTGVKDIKAVRGLQKKLEEGDMTKEEVQEEFKKEARRVANMLGRPVPEYAQEIDDTQA